VHKEGRKHSVSLRYSLILFYHPERRDYLLSSGFQPKYCMLFSFPPNVHFPRSIITLDLIKKIVNDLKCKKTERRILPSVSSMLFGPVLDRHPSDRKDDVNSK
jgi:hypothetical protein